MNLEGTIYEAGGFRMKDYSMWFIDAFLTKPDKKFPLKEGMTDKEYSGVKSHMSHYRPPLLVVFEVEPGVWSLNLAKDPDTVICQIDHNEKVLRLSDSTDREVVTARGYAKKIFDRTYRKSYDTKRSVVTRSHDDDYGVTTDIITKDFTNSKYISKLDISSLLKF